MTQFPMTRLRIRLLLSAVLISSALIVGLSVEALAGCAGAHKSTPDRTAVIQPAPTGPERTATDGRVAVRDTRGTVVARDAASRRD